MFSTLNEILMTCINGHTLLPTTKNKTNKDYRRAVVCVKICSHNHSAYISDVLGVREVGQVSVVELLSFQVVTVLARPQVADLDAAGLQKLLVGHSKRLPDGLGYGLSLDGDTGWRRES